ncbi:Transmembrane and TPR repeat-containing protein 1 [Eumeta japonica]|uniref:Transmembrane and TPR repeat-containing protein 1 n=1 Tax=Eumeta variegata TaxID=151549 RepID=A0A4C1UUU4_EUMVA|nr:Transmembrane and TPR repeat-containing protein 1 [Eumeta japonica]
MWRGCALAALGVLAKETGLAALLANAAIDLHRSWAVAATTNKNGNRWTWSQSGLPRRLARWAAALALVAGVRLLLLQGALPVFSPQDNPPAFHPHLLVRVMTFWYLAAFNWWLLLCPWGLSHDWQMGSVPLLTSPADPRNLLTGAALLALAALAYRCFADLEVD